eukprot:15452566-Alexandrium_andersonii.AAC.1
MMVSEAALLRAPVIAAPQSFGLLLLSAPMLPNSFAAALALAARSQTSGKWSELSGDAMSDLALTRTEDQRRCVSTKSNSAKCAGSGSPVG